MQDASYIRILYLLYDKLASYLSRVLCKSRLILSRINGPINYSLGPVYEFVCDSFRTGNLNCFRVK